MPSSEPRPLAGIRVLDLTRVVSGPFATLQLGDLGADVVKIEEPGRGDESRSYGPPFTGGESAYFLSINRNKRSCAVDLKAPAGRDLVLRLAAVADVVVENFRPGTLERLGLGWDTLSTVNERLILCSISGFGRTGPDAQRPGYDLVIQGEAGIMDITGLPDGPPTKVGASIADLVTGLYAAQAVLAAVLRRQHDGKGCRVDVAMLDALASLLTFNAGIYFATGQSPGRRGNAHPTISPYETFETADGWITVAAANDRFWLALCGVLGRDDLPEDPRFVSPRQRAAERSALQAILAPIFRRQNRHHWIERLKAAGIPCGKIRSVAEVCEARQLIERNVVQTVDHPAAGAVRHIASPLRFADEPPPPASPPPCLDEHRQEVLRDWLGLDAAATAAYAAHGAFGPAEQEERR